MATVGTSSSHIVEGQSITRPPLFDGTDYTYWKTRMAIYLSTLEFEIWDAIEQGYNLPTKVESDGSVIPKPRKEWDDKEKKLFTSNGKAMNILYCALDRAEFNRVSGCENAKEIWDKLEITHEGTSRVKESKISMLVHDYELFKMKPHESIKDMFTRFTDIINGLKALGKTYANTEQVRKILRCLPKSWEAKVTAIQESKDLRVLPLEELLGSLMTYEMELKRDDDEEKEKKNLALKSVRDNESQESDDDEYVLLAKKMKQFLKYNGRKGKREEPSQKEIICYKCKKPGHVRSDCPMRKKNSKKYKKKAMKVTWDDSESSSYSSSESEMANLCLMARDDLSEVSSNSSSNSNEYLSYNDLHDAFLEMQNDFELLRKKHKETKKKSSILAKQNEELRINNEELVKENEELKIKHNKLETRLTLLGSFDKIKEENVGLTRKIEELESTLAKFTQGKETLDKMLGKQKLVLDKTGIGYSHSGKQKYYKNYFVKSMQNTSRMTCYYCCRKGHYSYACALKNNIYIGNKKVWIPKGSRSFENLNCKTIWVPKGTFSNTYGPNKIWVPK